MTKASQRQSFFILLVTSLFFFYEFGLNNIFDVLEQPIANAYHLGATEMGFLASLYLYANLLFLIPAGALLDRFSPRWLITSAMAVCSTGVLLVPVAHQLYVLALARFLMGIGGGFCFVGCMRIAVNWFELKHLAAASGFIVTMGMLGGFLVQSPFAWLIGQVGWKMGLFVVALVGYAIMLLIALWVRDCPQDELVAFQAQRSQLRHHSLIASLRSTFSKVQNWACAIYGGCMNIPLAILGAVWGVPYLTNVYGIKPLEAALITGMLFIGTLIGSPIVGLISDALGRRKIVMQTGCVVSIVLSLIVIHLAHPSSTLLLILYLVLGFTTSTQVISYPTVAESNPSNVAGAAISIISLLMVLGGIVGQPLYGWLISRDWKGQLLHGTPVYTAQQYHHAIYVVPVIFLIGLGMTFLIRETHCRRD